MTTTETMKENKMGVMPVKKLIVNMSVPMMISMLVQALYNIVDSIFVAQISENALAAVTFAFPLQNLMIAAGCGTGVGMNALLSRSLGEKNFECADDAANNGLFLSIVNFIIFLLVGIFVTKPFIRSQTSVPEIIQAGDTYLSMLSMCSQLTGAILNIIFDPIMIFGLFGFPCLGVAGAAYATVFGQCIAAVLGLFLNLHMNKELHISLSRILHPKKEIIGQIYYVGVPSILMMAIGSIMTYCMNLILAAFSTTAAAVFGVYFKLQSFFFMPVFGLNNGLIPILAYNLGARKKQRINEALKFAITLAICIMLCGTLAFELVPEVLLRLFNASDDMLAIGTPALRIIAFHFPLAACGIVMGSIFQAFSQSFYSLIVSLGRQLVVLIPVAWLLSLSGNVNNVWWCFLIAESVAVVLSTFFFRKVYRKKVAPL